MRLITGIVLFAFGVAGGCDGSVSIGPPPIAGSGVSREETRAVDAFHALEAGSALQVNVMVNSGAKPSVKISGDDNIVPLIESVVRDGTLILRNKDNSSISPKLPLVVEVVAGELDGVEGSGATTVKVKGSVKVNRFVATASGAAQVSVEGVDAAQAVARATGAAHVVLSGSAPSLSIDAAGAGQVKAQGLQVENAQVSISGAASIAVRASKSAAGSASDAAQLELYGNPPKNTVSTSGAAGVVEKQ